VARKSKRRSEPVTRPVEAGSIRSFLRVPMARRLEWIEEMIRLQAALPARVRKLLDKHRELARRPTR
jgi:hypothetical protein